jgi:hypothetical protein
MLPRPIGNGSAKFALRLISLPLILPRIRRQSAQPPSSRTYSIGDGDRCGQGKPLEHNARSPSSALVQQLNVVVCDLGVLALFALRLRSESCREFAILLSF